MIILDPSVKTCRTKICIEGEFSQVYFEGPKTATIRGSMWKSVLEGNALSKTQSISWTI